MRVFWSRPKSSNAWASLYCCLCWPELLPCGYTHCFGKCNGESPRKGTCLQFCTQIPHTAGEDGFLLHRCLPEGTGVKPFIGTKSLHRKQTKKSNCWINPAHSWSSLLKTLRTSALLFPYSLSSSPGQHLLYHSPKQLPLSSPFSPLAMDNQVMKQGIPHAVIIPSMPPLWTLKVIPSPALPILSWLLLPEITPQSSTGLCVCWNTSEALPFATLHCPLVNLGVVLEKELLNIFKPPHPTPLQTSSQGALALDKQFPHLSQPLIYYNILILYFCLKSFKNCVI